MYHISNCLVPDTSRVDVCFYYAPGWIIWRRTSAERTWREASALVPCVRRATKESELKCLSSSCPNQLNHLSKQRCKNPGLFDCLEMHRRELYSSGVCAKSFSVNRTHTLC